MTTLPLRAAIEKDWRYSNRWVIEDSAGLIEATGYATKEDAEKDIPDLLRFLGDHLECLCVSIVGGRKMNDSKNVVQVTKDEAVLMFTALGMKTAATWTKARMSEKLVKLGEAYEATHKFEGDNVEAQAIFDKVFAAIKGGEGIELIKGLSADGATEALPDNDGEKKEPKEKKEKVLRTPSGPREGSQAAKLNEAIKALTGPFDTKTLAETTSIPTARVGAHLVSLVKKGVVKKVEAGKYEQVS